jgi:hypothetical protein
LPSIPASRVAMTPDVRTTSGKRPLESTVTEDSTSGTRDDDDCAKRLRVCEEVSSALDAQVQAPTVPQDVEHNTSTSSVFLEDHRSSITAPLQTNAEQLPTPAESESPESGHIIIKFEQKEEPAIHPLPQPHFLHHRRKPKSQRKRKLPKSRNMRKRGRPRKPGKSTRRNPST